MSRKFDLGGDIYDEEAIAFCRKLHKPTKAFPGKEPMAYVVQLKPGLAFDPSRGKGSLFLTEKAGAQLQELLREGSIKING